MMLKALLLLKYDFSANLQCLLSDYDSLFTSINNGIRSESTSKLNVKHYVLTSGLYTQITQKHDTIHKRLISVKTGLSCLKQVRWIYSLQTATALMIAKKKLSYDHVPTSWAS